MRIITLAIVFLIGISAEAQIIRAEPFYVAPEAGVTNLLLDDYPGAAVAYSLRKLDKDYTGSAIRVRRTDNTEQDIGFLASGYLDTAALKTFVGTGATDSAMVVTWYNQADSSGVFGVKNLSQSTAANQPRIMRAGAIVRNVDGIIGIYGAGAQCMTINNSTATMKFMHDGTISSTFSVQQFGTVANPAATYGIAGNNVGTSVNRGFYMAYDDVPSRNNSHIVGVTTGTAGQISVQVVKNDIVTPNDQSLISVILDPANATAANRSYVYVNGGAANQDNAATITVSTANASFNFQIMSLGNNDSRMVGYMQELIIYNSNQSSNRTAIRDNINSFYSIY